MSRSWRIIVLLGFVGAVACASGSMDDESVTGTGTATGAGTGTGTGGGGGSGGTAPCGEEVCDGFDNDCDGQVDEDCPCEYGDEQACYSGSPATVDIGECHRGVQTCVGTRWGPCEGEVTPSEEVRDGFDNDCDGLVDEECPCDDGDEQECYSGSPATVDIGECKRGTQVCEGSTWGPCEGEITPKDEECNGLDDDCDGVTDLDPTDIDLGTFLDAAADQLTVTIPCIAAERSVWYSFIGEDDTDTAGDEYHVDVRFLDNPGDDYEMDVHRGSCREEDRIATSEKESFDWYTDFPATDTGCTVSSPCGEGDCEAAPAGEGVNDCDDDTATFYVRIRRTDGAASCDNVTVEISNGVY